jgi:D-alanyl-D-alanine carboxypeptidase/D-alanyl-D-alanine-endopeptidase (penicillin-binding protein 4)
VSRRRIVGGVLWLVLLAGRPAGADLRGQIDAIIGAEKNVEFSIHVIKAQTGQTLYGHRADQAVIPASNMKLITTAAALQTLGPGFVYVTKVGLVGRTLVIIGCGDPLLGDRQTEAGRSRPPEWIPQDIAARLRHAGISSVEDIVVDTSIFDDQRVHPSWPTDELNRWYACEICGLNYNDNCIGMKVQNSQGRIAVELDPETRYVKIVDQVRPVSGSKGDVGAYRQPGVPNTLLVKGTCSKEEGPFDVAVERPANFFGFLVAESLNKAGIEVRGQLVERTLGSAETFVPLAEYRTPLRDCLMRANKDSLGMVAEALFKTMAASANGGRNGSWATGQQVVSGYLLSLGISRSQFTIDDGSGLSRRNKLSAACVTRVLQSVYQGPQWPMYRDSLAIGGVDGTTRRYFKEAKYRGKILGKTGNISQVKSLSGVCQTATGDVLFSILTNDGATREAINKIAEAIMDNPCS